MLSANDGHTSALTVRYETKSFRADETPRGRSRAQGAARARGTGARMAIKSAEIGRNHVATRHREGTRTNAEHRGRTRTKTFPNGSGNECGISRRCPWDVWRTTRRLFTTGSARRQGDERSFRFNRGIGNRLRTRFWYVTYRSPKSVTRSLSSSGMATRT